MARLVRYSILLLLCFSIPAPAFSAGEGAAVYTSKDDFDTVKDNIVFAINGRGMVINNTSHIGEMLERTGRDLGAARQVYLKAEALEFCSATVSRKMMEADPRNIIYCPYIIAIYVLPNEPATTYVSFRRPDAAGSVQSRQALKEVDNLLNDIIKEALH